MTVAAPRARLHRELALIIAIKLLALTVIWWCAFRSELSPPADSAAVAARVLATAQHVRTEEPDSRTKHGGTGMPHGRQGER